MNKIIEERKQLEEIKKLESEYNDKISLLEIERNLNLSLKYKEVFEKYIGKYYEFETKTYGYNEHTYFLHMKIIDVSKNGFEILIADITKTKQYYNHFYKEILNYNSKYRYTYEKDFENTITKICNRIQSNLLSELRNITDENKFMPESVKSYIDLLKSTIKDINYT